MTLIKSEYTNLDKENNIVHLSFFIDNNEIAKIIFDYNDNKIKVIGDLYKLIGYKDSEEDIKKYNEFLKIQKWFAKEILDRI